MSSVLNSVQQSFSIMLLSSILTYALCVSEFLSFCALTDIVNVIVLTNGHTIAWVGLAWVVYNFTVNTTTTCNKHHFGNVTVKDATNGNQQYCTNVRIAAI